MSDVDGWRRPASPHTCCADCECAQLLVGGEIPESLTELKRLQASQVRFRLKPHLAEDPAPR
ncbi:hypothetical protein [Nocardioides sp. T2.26MG-1]|uniref:hypothetical protein n=1 Tax=Nocardioides sp. T2.26MG-1 TaxID=3041166 RepID=UPI00253FCF8B|nr:hypothetical protein [Nocardioides sp. T2.26MG-1]